MKSVTKFSFCLLLFLFACKEEAFDQKTGQSPIMTHQALDSVLASFQTIATQQLPEDYIEYAQLDGKFSANYTHSQFYVIESHQLYQYLVGKHRIKDFLPKDIFYKRAKIKGEDQYYFVDKRILHKLLDLILALKKQGYDYDALEVYYGWRHPRYNQEIGGASMSMHMKGIAVDFRVGDIDRDGDKDADDKAIVLSILEETIIGNEGGIGKYPKTQCVHIDVRGSKARWDSY